jgi:hypothetical protein
MYSFDVNETELPGARLPESVDPPVDDDRNASVPPVGVTLCAKLFTAVPGHVTAPGVIVHTSAPPADACAPYAFTDTFTFPAFVAMNVTGGVSWVDDLVVANTSVP